MSNETDVLSGTTGSTIRVATFTDDYGNEIQLVALIGAASSTAGIVIPSDDSAAVQVTSFSNVRRTMTLTNTDSVRCYLKWSDDTVSSAVWHFFIEPGERWEMAEPILADLFARWATGAGTPYTGFADVGAALVGVEVSL